LFARLSYNKSKRPLIDDKTNGDEFIAMHVFERSFYYNQAKHKVIVDDKSIEETINDIVVLLAISVAVIVFLKLLVRALTKMLTTIFL
jgi:shikimate kinase